MWYSQTQFLEATKSYEQRKLKNRLAALSSIVAI